MGAQLVAAGGAQQRGIQVGVRRHGRGGCLAAGMWKAPAIILVIQILNLAVSNVRKTEIVGCWIDVTFYHHRKDTDNCGIC